MKTTDTIKVKANGSRRTFTIRKYIDGKVYSKFRTYSMDREEFEENEMNTDQDWYNFLMTSNYYLVK